MSDVAPFMRFDFPLLPGARPPSACSDPSEKLQRSLESLFPDLLVHGTRNYLLNVTTSLTSVSGRTHEYFARVSNMLAFDRMMRGFMRLAAASSPFSFNFPVVNCWNGMVAAGQPAPSPWALQMAPAAQAAHPAFAVFAQFFNPQQTLPAPVQAWGFPAPAQPAANPAMTFFASMLQPGGASARQAEPWSDYNALLMVPVAFLAAAPALENWWRLS